MFREVLETVGQGCVAYEPFILKSTGPRGGFTTGVFYLIGTACHVSNHDWNRTITLFTIAVCFIISGVTGGHICCNCKEAKRTRVYSRIHASPEHIIEIKIAIEDVCRFVGPFFSLCPSSIRLGAKGGLKTQRKEQERKEIKR